MFCAYVRKFWQIIFAKLVYDGGVFVIDYQTIGCIRVSVSIYVVTRSIDLLEKSWLHKFEISLQRREFQEFREELRKASSNVLTNRFRFFYILEPERLFHSFPFNRIFFHKYRS